MGPRTPCLTASDYVYFLKRQLDTDTGDDGSDSDQELLSPASHHIKSSTSSSSSSKVTPAATGIVKKNGQNGGDEARRGRSDQNVLESGIEMPKLSELLRNLTEDLKTAPIG